MKEHDVDLLPCLDKADVSEPRGGKGGVFGIGGIGGEGGKGGKPATKTIAVRNGDGTTSYQHIPVAGGQDGVRGRAGMDGKAI